ncbi:MAG: LysE family transporter [Peptococcaceae bacterium]|nr:LysE family transporter [Peptococcaceae bacterium]
MEIYLQGLTMGLAYVAPIGVQNLFVINGALSCSRYHALLRAWIVIFFDITLSMACFFGIGALMERYTWLQMLILLLGSLVVIWIGIGLLRTRPDEIKRQSTDLPLLRMISTACVVTWFNPQAIIDGTMMLGAFRAVLPPDSSLFFLAGVVSASCLWFTLLTLLISVFRERFNARILRGINIICGIVIVCYGLRLLLHFIQLL